MASYITVFLDTTAPATPTILLDGGSTYASDVFIDCTIDTADADVTNYQMKIWGTVDPTNDASVQATEAESDWVSYSSTRQIKVSAINGQKTVYLKLRDDVHNESGIVQDSITYDGTKPVVTVTAPDVDKISTIEGKDVVSFSFTVNEIFTEYRVKVVNSTGATEDLGTTIPTTAGSINTSGVGTFDTTTAPITVSINGEDLQSVSSGDGSKTIKIFARDESGLWSS